MFSRHEIPENFHGSKQKAFTLVEVIISAFLITIIGAAAISLMIMITREQRVGFVEQRVSENADRLQDRITERLREASREAGVFYAEPTGPYYHRIVFREGVGAANQEFRFDPDTATLTYDPDVNEDNDKEIIGFGNDSIARIDDVKFRSGMKTGGIPDSAIILVVVEVSDHGYAKKSFRDTTGKANWVMSTRSFAVNLRKL